MPTPPAPGPLLSIGDAVAEIARSFPSMSHSSLRFLEREGLITAQRTPGGHRMYSARDIDRVIQIKTWQQQRLSLDDIRERLARQDRIASPHVLTRRFLDQVTGGHLHEAAQTVLEASTLGMPLDDLFGRVLVPALVETGNRWESGELLVAQEKEISELVRELVVELTLQHAQLVEGSLSFVAACVAGEKHELGLRMICGLLRARGCGVHFLGADVDTRFIVDAVRLRHPEGVLLSAGESASLATVEQAVSQAGNLPDPAHPSVIVGGSIVHQHGGTIETWGAITVSDHDLARTVDRILLQCERGDRAR
jgi:DNA-binding transcriptional MerR regulator